MSENQKELAKVIEKYFGADAGYLDIDCFTLARRIIEAGWLKPVRCKDCRQWSRNSGISESPNGHCFYHCIDTNGHDFCSYGERRERENDNTRSYSANKNTQ